MPPEAREGYEQILRETLRAMKDADAGDYRMGSPPRTPEEEDAVAEALLQRLEAFKALTGQEKAAHRRAEIEQLKAQRQQLRESRQDAPNRRTGA